MKRNKILIFAYVLCTTVLSVNAQHSTFFNVDDARERGYYNRPYLRYEAESGVCQANGAYIGSALDFNQTNIQSEASNQQALQLISINDYVEWTNDEAADGMTIRFSIPDNAEGTGATGNLALYVDGAFVQDIELNSKWAWQYILKTGDMKYPYNVAATDKFPRMFFDEVRVKLANKIPQGKSFKLIKKDNDGVAYTIDFVELEAIPAKVEKPITGDVVEFTGNGSELVSFVANNAGKTIYIPEGKYEVPTRLYVIGNGTKLIGAGIWYTQLHFVADPNNVVNVPTVPTGYSARGIQSSASNVEVSGFYITTENERRYQNYSDPGKGMGKGFAGSFGENSIIRDVWVEHFECGAWIEQTDGLLIEKSRFRNNYADGINLSYASKNAIVRYCSFRNNGDDDMASWSRLNIATENNTFQYCISEYCWRAAAIGFFGGKQNKALNCVIVDPTEVGIRVNNDFTATPFSDEGYFEIRDISIYRAGCKQGTVGETGNLWGHRAGAVFISASGTLGKYDVRNFHFSNVDIIDSKGDAIHINAGSTYFVRNIIMDNIKVNGAALSTSGTDWEYFGLYINQGSGSANNIFCIDFQNMGEVTSINTTTARGFSVNEYCENTTRMIRVGDKIDLKYFIPSSFSTNISYTIVSGETYVSVNAQGLVTGLEEGTAQVKITDDKDSEITYTIIVKDIAVTGLSLSEETLTLAVGDIYKLEAAIEPANATYKTLTWVSSNTAKATVRLGTVVAVATGTVYITVTTADGKLEKTCVVTIVDPNAVVETGADKLLIIAYGNTIQISGCQNGEIISVYDVMGRKIYSRQLVNKSVETISGLPEGVYVVCASKTQERQKVIVKKY